MPHIHEKIDFTASAYIVNDGAVFLRKHDKYDHWLDVGGHIDLGEDPVEAVLREVKEETGLEVELIGRIIETEDEDDERDLLPPRFMNRHRINKKHEHVDLIYFARSKNRDVIPEYESDRSDNWHWFTEDEIKDSTEIKPRIKTYALAALKAAREEA